MKQIAKCVALIMSAGTGTRFGADKPKQYCNMAGKPIIEYALDACKHSTLVDEIVIVAADDYVEELHNEYGYPVTKGGDNRTKSLANGLKYIADNYYCEKVIIANAVCPLMTEKQVDRYFRLLDDYDYVLTTWKVVSTLGRYDGTLVNRDDYFQCMEPEAYRFQLLYENYKSDYPLPYIFHQLPKDAKGYYCFDYPYTMKITYQRDVQIAEILYNEEIRKPKDEAIRHNINLWLSAFGNYEIVTDWLMKMPNYLKELINKWDITSYSMNPQAFATCVYEAHSSKYGEVIVKFHAPTGRYDVEKEYYLKADRNKHMAKLLDYDDDYRALLIEKVKPGIQVKYNREDKRIDELLSDFMEYMIPASCVSESIDVPSIQSEYYQSKNLADMHNFMPEFRKNMQSVAESLWKEYFEESDKYFLHRDLHRRNMLKSFDTIRAIDPLGVIGPKEFEFTISLIIETKANMENAISIHNAMIEHYSSYCDAERLRAAAFITWVHKMNEYVFAKRDDYYLAGWAAQMIRDLFFNGDECIEDNDYYGIYKNNV